MFRQAAKKEEPSFSILIPARNEESCLERTVRGIIRCFSEAGATDYEILLIDDNSTDATGSIMERLGENIESVVHIAIPQPGGFGRAVIEGLKYYRGESAAIVMADGSESPCDVLNCYEQIKGGASCVFGSRFVSGGSVFGYPRFKFAVNRFGNCLIRMLFGTEHNDITNGFKAYRREVLDDVQPLESRGFELSVELPIKAILRGHQISTIPISWHRRTGGKSKFCLWSTSLRYLATLFRLCHYRFRLQKFQD